MTKPQINSFAQITENNRSVDQTIENFVHVACEFADAPSRLDRVELEKTTRLLFLSSLILGENGDT